MTDPDTSIWPASARRQADGALELGGMSVRDVAGELGTPVLVIDETDARGRAARIRRAFESAASRHGTTASVYYAGKALLTADVARWMIDEGLGVDVCTGGELTLALAAGVPAASIGFHGNNKRMSELAQAVDAGVGTIVIDSADEVERLAEVVAARGATQDVVIRVNTGVHAETHAFLATAHDDQKFGVPRPAVRPLAERIAGARGLRLVGLHAHIGSQIFGSSGFAASAERLIELLADLGEVRDLNGMAPVSSVNLGGGFGIAYTPSDTPEPIEQIACDIVAAVADASHARGVPVPSVRVEPGRFIIGPAGVTLYEVGTVKHVDLGDGAGRAYVSVDGGMSDNPRYVLYGAAYSATLASRTSGAPSVLSRVVGVHCETGDIVVENEHLPSDIAPGDLVAVAATGAYTAPLSSTYNLTPRPPIVAVRDGHMRVLVRRETIADVLARDEGLAHGAPRDERTR